MRHLLLASPWFIACLLAWLLSGCDGRPSAQPLFPLEAGHRWTYRVTTELEDGGIDRETLTLRTLGAESLAASDAAPEGGSAWRRRSDSGIDYWLRADASGIYRVASKSDLDAAPLPDNPPRFVLRAPFVPGTHWQATTTSYLLMRRNEFPREIRHSHPAIPMSFQIEADDASVDVPAGHFERCVRVKGVATVRLYADPVRGWSDMPLTTIEWYCPPVGLVRVERAEPAPRLAYLTGGSRRLELESWQ